MAAPLRTAVIGVGHLGRHHARLLASMHDVTLTAVVDTAAEKAAEASASTGARACGDFRELLDGVDAVVVAVPTELHREIAVPFLERGVAVLVEKPLSRSIPDADAILEAARRNHAVLGVGHTERHNPAVAAILPLVTSPRFIEVHRLSAFPERSLDIDVVFDLMIHDLDVLLSVVEEEVVGVEAVGVPVLTDRVDIANARLRFAGGCIANVTASRISRDRVRKVRFIEPASYVSVDYASRELEVWRLRKVEGGRPAIEGGPVAVPEAEPLRRELEDFVAAVRDRRAPRVDGHQGRRALALATRINDAMTQG
jgi:predicted dehydrogenase